MNKMISLVSTTSEDILINKKNEIVSKQPGGPLLFMENALEKLEITFHSYYGSPLPVKILITEHGELGKIDQIVKIQPFPVDTVSDFTIVSTILNEWNLENITNYTGILFLDIQGYVRDGKEFGKKKYWQDIIGFYTNIFCLKGTAEEIRYLPEVVVEKQKNKLLIITNGKQPIEIWFRGEKKMIPITSVVKKVHAIGAGDTFFANFASQFKDSQDIEKSATFAIQQTNKFLLSLD